MHGLCPLSMDSVLSQEDESITSDDNSSKPKGRLIALLVVLLLVSLVWTTRLLRGFEPIDDAYITYRYALNISQGLGFRYNATDPPILGTSAPLYTLGLALWGSIFDGSTIPNCSFYANIIADCLTALLLYWIGIRLSASRFLSIGVALAFIFDGRCLEFSCAGMETPFTILLVLACVAASMTGRHKLSFVTAAISAIHRPDGLLLLLSVITIRTWKLKKIPVYELLCAVFTLLPWLATASYLFGSPVPHSLIAKASGVYWSPASTMLEFMLADFMLLPPGGLLIRAFAQHELAFLVNLLILILAIFHLKGCRGYFALALAWVASYSGAFALGNPIPMGWYRAPIHPILLILTVSCISAAPKRLAWLRILWVVLIVSSQCTAFHSSADNRLLWEEAPSRTRERAYAEAATLVIKTLGPTAHVAAPEIGSLGWHGPSLYILDTVGLVSPQSLAHYPLPKEQLAYNHAIAPQLILDEKPDAVVSFGQFIELSLQRNEPFLSGYQLIARTDPHFHGSKGLYVYKRK